MNTALLHQKVESLKAYPVFSGKDPELSRFETVIAGLSEWQLFRINPLVFAKENGFDARLCVDIFIHGAKIGIFDFAWNLLCPGCGGVEYSVHSMDQIQSNLFHCTICHIDVSTELDNQIEAAFTINNSIYPLALDPFASFDNYRKYFFSSNYVRSQELQGYSQSHFVKFAVIPAGEARPMVFTPEKDALYRLLSMVAHTQIFLPVRAEAAPGPRHFQIDINAGGFMYNELPLPPEEVTLEVHNRTKKPLATVLFKTDFTLMHAILKEHPNTRLPYLTAKALLSTQSFRDLFSVQDISRDLCLTIKNLTLFFTDLQGSTALYEKDGDFQAYNLVRRHFDHLMPIVRNNSGAVVKTMGDSIMATFADPINAVRTAVEMVRSMPALSKSGDIPIGMRIGLHEGAAVVVNVDERLDYFGQTVNIASRIKDLAGAGEIWLTEPVFGSSSVKDFLAAERISHTVHQKTLKGIATPYAVHQCRLT